jgi:hypothetical protein
MRKLAQIIFSLAVILGFPVAAKAKVHISVDLSSQKMDVQASNGESYSWPISSARSGYVTPHGVFSATSLQAMHYSRKYHNSPMPHSIFFHGGFAIHGTYEMRSLGRPASHGCVRISPANAAKLYSLVRAEGATITITGTPPHSLPFASQTSHSHNRRAHAQASPNTSARHDDSQRIFGATIFR